MNETTLICGQVLNRKDLPAVNPTCGSHRSTRFYPAIAVVLGLIVIGRVSDAQAVCGLEGGIREQFRGVSDPRVLRSLSLELNRSGICSACHLARYGGPRNEYGSAINTLLTIGDREDPVRQRDAGRRVSDIPANPQLPDSPSFGELFREGWFPGNSRDSSAPAFPEISSRGSGNLTVQQARDIVNQVEAESRFGILQLSNTSEVTPDVAETLASFEGEILILGIRSLAPEVAAALAQSRAANVWLHSVTSVSAEAAEAIVKLPGDLVLTSLTQLTSVPLAEKLAARPGSLSFPYMKSMTPEIAAALAKHERRLTLSGLADVTPEVQEKLAETVGGLSLPNLTSLDSQSLAKKLAGPLVLLSKVKRLSAENAELFVGVQGQASFFGGVYLDAAALTPDVAAVFSTRNAPVNLVLLGAGPILDETLRTLLRTRVSLTLQDIEKLTPEQIRIIAEEYAAQRVSTLSLPGFKTLDSGILAETLGPAAFPGVTSISPEAALAFANLPYSQGGSPNSNGGVRFGGDLSLPSLRELSPETAQLLMKKRWLSISFPALSDVPPDIISLFARRTFRLTLGITDLPSEFADAFKATPTDSNLGGGYILLPYLSSLSPEAARILVTSMNRGVEDRGYTRISKSPKLILGGDLGFACGGFTSLSPELAMELARYEGILGLQGLGNLPDGAAAALASFPGPYLILSGPATEKLSPEAASALAKVPGNLQLPLRELDSVPLSERFARQITWTLSDLETVSKEAAPALSNYKQFFRLRKLTVLDSPDVARRLVADPSGTVTLPALANITPEAAAIIVKSPKPIYLGLTTLDSSAVARAFAESEQAVKLPRLRAATPEVIEILNEAKRTETPPLQSLYVLPPMTDQECPVESSVVKPGDHR